MGAGGDAPSVPIWDMAVLIGATLFISTVVILVWTQPNTYDLDGQEEVLTVHTGLSQAGLTFESTCISSPDSDTSSTPVCEDLSVWIVSHDGSESWNGELDGAEEIDLLVDGASESTVSLNGKLDSGEYRLILDGEGQYTLKLQ